MMSLIRCALFSSCALNACLYWAFGKSVEGYTNNFIGHGVAMMSFGWFGASHLFYGWLYLVYKFKKAGEAAENSAARFPPPS